MTAPTLAPAPAPAASHDRLERAIAREINDVRRAHGLRGVRQRPRLVAAADRHSRELARTGRLSHIALDGSTAAERLRFARGPVGEVIAWSSRRPRARSLVAQWLRSPSHRAVLLDKRFRRVGIGARRGRGGTVITADFARR